MSMADAKFEKVTRTDRALYGPEKLVLCGFPSEAQSKFKAVLAMAGLQNIPVVWATQQQADSRLGDLFALPPEAGRGISSTLPRAIIVAGITEKKLHVLMAVCRKTGMKPALWATLTSTSENWQLKELLAELSAERKALGKR